jgi:hypothetical protein
LIISTFTLVLQQSPNIIASALWRVVQGVGALLTQLRNHARTTLFTKARYFLVQAIAKFSDSGIFFLIFKVVTTHINYIFLCYNLTIHHD